MPRQFYIFIVLLFFPSIAHAQTANNLSLQEVSFNAENDFLIFKNISDQEINLHGLEFWDDKLFKKIEKDLYLQPQQTATLIFNSSQNDSSAQIFTSHKGLTATTEQIYLKKNDQIEDFFCWISEKPSQAELKEWDKNNYSQFWNGKTLNDCFPSKGIKKAQSILRISAGQSIANWKLQDLPEKDTNSKSTSSTSKSSSSKNTTKTSAITLSNDQTPSKQILISEIFPAPNQKSNQTSEWIELFNPSKQSININGWYLDDEEGGSKPYRFGNLTIKSGETLLIGAAQSKLNLNNSDEQIRLFDAKKNLVDLLEYKKSVSGQSYSLITFAETENSQPLWLWSEEITPDQPNPQLFTLEGIISKPAQFQTPYFFEITNQNNLAQIIIFNEKTLPAALAKTIIIKDQSIKLSAFTINKENIKDAPSQPIFQLHAIETNLQPEPAKEDFNLSLPFICVIIATALYLLQKKYQWIKLT
jgi:hypothetical protein